MTKAHAAGRCGRASLGRILSLGCLGLLLAGGSVRAGVPTPAQFLGYHPHQLGVDCTTPAADKVEACKVDWVRDQPKGGWTLTLKDSEGNMLRRFVDTNAETTKNRPNVWEYYKDGVAVYAEIDTNFSGKADQFRWYNAGGSKWGVDANEDGRIDHWKVISPEEVSQEILLALANNDYGRFQSLLLTEAELKALDLPAEQANRIREQLKSAQEKFQETVGKLTKLTPKATWIHLETVAPQCVAADGATGRAEIIKHSRGTLLYDNGNGSDWVQTGEMYQIGSTWRLVSAPVPGAAAPDSPGGNGKSLPLEDNPELQKLISKLTDLDKNVPPSSGTGANSALAQHHLQRANILEQIVGKVKATERDPWIRQVADSLSTAAQASEAKDSAAMDRLLNLEKQLANALPAGHALTAYVTYREMQADYSRNLPGNGGNGKIDFNKIQETWLGRLGKFIQAFPNAEDTPDALLQAGMVSEFLNKEVEAKNWYGQLVKNFNDKPQAKKAEGSIRRLELEGQSLKLTGPTLSNADVTFDIDQTKGKVVVVYYWASWNNQCTGDFAKLKQMLDAQSGKMELVCVNLDNTIDEARKYLSSTPAPGTHLHQDGGLESKMATDYGIQVLPTIFLIGKDGKVTSRNGQIANLEDEIKKLVK